MGGMKKGRDWKHNQQCSEAILVFVFRLLLAVLGTKSGAKLNLQGLYLSTVCLSGFGFHNNFALSPSVSLENVLLDVKELQRGMDLTKREYTMHDHNTLLKEFILNNEGKLKKLQDDAKIAQVDFCVLCSSQRSD